MKIFYSQDRQAMAVIEAGTTIFDICPAMAPNNTFLGYSIGIGGRTFGMFETIEAAENELKKISKFLTNDSQKEFYIYQKKGELKNERKQKKYHRN